MKRESGPKGLHEVQYSKTKSNHSNYMLSNPLLTTNPLLTSSVGAVGTSTQSNLGSNVSSRFQTQSNLQSSLLMKSHTTTALRGTGMSLGRPLLSTIGSLSSPSSSLFSGSSHLRLGSSLENKSSPRSSLTTSLTTGRSPLSANRPISLATGLTRASDISTPKSPNVKVDADSKKMKRKHDQSNLPLGPSNRGYINEMNELLGDDTYRPQYDGVKKKLALTADLDDSKSSKRIKLSTPSVIATSEIELRQWKMNLINKISCSLIEAPDFKDPENASHISLRETITGGDGMTVDYIRSEFILKVALYCRQELNIRTTANFLLACAAFYAECRPFLRKYFRKAIILPSDLIDVAEMYQTFHDERIRWGALPAALRKAMDEKFQDFDEYQLAKYNKKDKSKAKRKKNMKEDSKENLDSTYEKKFLDSELTHEVDTDSEEEDEETLEMRTYTLKQLIRHIHIREPAPLVMGLLGKNYPETSDAFRTSRLPGSWDSERAGKRMRLSVPETWETQISTRGNKAEVWESLIDHKKLPFMAMLRNLRNLIRAGISSKHHDNVIKRLQDPRSVANSRQFPFRFLSAYEVLNQLEKDYHETEEALVNQAVTQTSERQPVRGRGRGRGGRGGGRGRGRGASPFRGSKSKDKPLEENKYTTELLERYRQALTEAVKIAIKHNVPPIRGHTLVICDVSSTMPCTSFRGMGKPRLVQDVAAMMCMMCHQAASEASTVLYYSDYLHVHNWESTSGGLLQNAADMVKQAQSKNLASNAKSLQGCLQEILTKRTQIDNVLFIGSIDTSHAEELGVMDFVRKYRSIVNPRLVFFENAYKPQSRAEVSIRSDLDVTVYGYSDQILRFLAQRGDAQLLDHVETIDKAYDLPPTRLRAVDVHNFPVASATQIDMMPHVAWRHVTVFVSSTFLDMHGERDILTRFVMPRLREKLFPHRVVLDEIDLRWGLQQDPTVHGVGSVLQCLRQVTKSSYFLGLLGDRYGWVPDDYGWSAADQELRDAMPWLEKYPTGRSITELEFMAGGLAERDDDDERRAFFFLREPSSLRHVPNNFQQFFACENAESAQKLNELKERLYQSNFDVCKYTANFGGVFEQRPVMRELEDFAARVYTLLFNAITEDVEADDMDEDQGGFWMAEATQRNFLELQQSRFVGRARVLKEAIRAVDLAAGSVLRLTGDRGCGKTALMAMLAFNLGTTSDTVVSYFVNAQPDVISISGVLEYLLCHISRLFALTSSADPAQNDYEKIRRRFISLLEDVGKRGNLTLILDGLDLLEDRQDIFSLNWLPEKLSKTIRVIITCSKPHALYNSASRRSDGTEFHVPPLDVLDKGSLIRANLSAFGKSLAESAFNNQMKWITGKKDANSPLYLSIACEEIRMFGHFEELDTKLRQLAPSLPQLLTERIARIEAENGTDQVRLALALLNVARAELSFVDMRLLLALGQHFPPNGRAGIEEMRLKMSGLSPIPHFPLLRLITSLQFLLQPNESGLLKLNRSHATHLILGRLLGPSLAPYKQVAHRLLAAYFLHLTNSSGNVTFQNCQAGDIIQSLPYHLLHGDSLEMLRDVITNIHYINALSECYGLKSLLDLTRESVAGNRRLQKDWEKLLASPIVNEILDFVRSNIHILTKYPQLFYQQARNTTRASHIYSATVQHLQQHPPGNEDLLILEVINREDSDKRVAQVTAHTDFAGANTALAVRTSDGLMAVGTNGGSILLLKPETAEVVRSLYGHGTYITCLHFINDMLLASGAEDGSIALWDTELGIRTQYLRNTHKRRVSDLSSWENSIISVGWDCEMRVTASKDIKNQWWNTFAAIINTVHTNEEAAGLVALGLWNKTIVLYQLNKRSNKGILRGHNTSIQKVRFSTDAVHLASASLDGEVRLWHTRSGTPVGRYRIQSPSPMLALDFTTNLFGAAADNGRLFIWSSQLGIETSRLGGSGDAMDKDPIACAQIQKTSRKWLAIGRHSGRLEIWNYQTGRLIDQSTELHVARITAIAWGTVRKIRDSHHAILTGSADRMVSLVDVSDTGKLKGVLQVFDGDAGVSSLVWENRYCAFGRDQGAVELRNIRSSSQDGTKWWTMHQHTLRVTAMDILPRHNLLATTSLDMSLAFYSISAVTENSYSGEAKPMLVRTQAHQDGITALAWDHSMEAGATSFVLCTGANDGVVKLWSLTGAGGMMVDQVSLQEVMVLRSHQSPISSVCCENFLVASGSADGELKLWTSAGALITSQKLGARVSACQLLLPDDLQRSTRWSDASDDMEGKTKQEKQKARRAEALEVRNSLMYSRERVHPLQLMAATEAGESHLLHPLASHQMLCVPLHTGPVRGLRFFSNRAVTCADDATLCELSTPAGNDLVARPSMHETEVTCHAALPKAGVHVTGDAAGIIVVHWMKSEMISHTRIITPDALPVLAVALVQTGKVSFRLVFTCGQNLYSFNPPIWSELPETVDLANRPNNTFNTHLTVVKSERPLSALVALDGSLVCADWDGKMHLMKIEALKSIKASKDIGPTVWLMRLQVLEKRKMLLGIKSDFNHHHFFFTMPLSGFKANPDANSRKWPSEKWGRLTCLAASPSEAFVAIGTETGHVIVLSDVGDNEKTCALKVTESDLITDVTLLSEEIESEKYKVTMLMAVGMNSGNLSVWRLELNPSEMKHHGFGRKGLEFCQVGLHMSRIGISVVAPIDQTRCIVTDKQGNVDYLKFHV